MHIYFHQFKLRFGAHFYYTLPQTSLANISTNLFKNYIIDLFDFRTVLISKHATLKISSLLFRFSLHEIT